MRDKADIQRDAWLNNQLRQCEEVARLLERLQGALRTGARGLSSLDEAMSVSNDITEVMEQLRSDISKELFKGFPLP